MKRDLNQLSNNKFQVLVIGGGIYGSCVAWDAALRGLSVALIERSDFGSEASANSLKIVHGGLRYLQDLNPMRVRQMAKERSTWLQIAPHLVQPLACLTPTYPNLSRSKLVLSTALRLNELITSDRDRSSRRSGKLPISRIISLKTCQNILQDPDLSDITGGAIWYDAQIIDSERLLLAFLLSAAGYGAVIANYVRALQLNCHDNLVNGVHAKDILTGDEFDINADIIVNCTGAWVDSLLTNISSNGNLNRFTPSKAMNIVIRGARSSHAIGLSTKNPRSDTIGSHKKNGQMLFFVPWKDYTIVGTKHFVDPSPISNRRVLDYQAAEFIKDINRAYPRMNIRREDVLQIHTGFLPMDNRFSHKGEIKLLRDSRIHDHETEDGVSGLITIVGVKYTTARATAERVVDLITEKLDVNTKSCKTQELPIYGGEIVDFPGLFKHAVDELSINLELDVIEHLVRSYGSEYPSVIAYMEEQPKLGERVTSGSPVIKAEVVYAVREEMGLRLSDIIQRRTGLGTVERPDFSSIRVCAEIMANELDWSSTKIESEVHNVFSSY